MQLTIHVSEDKSKIFLALLSLLKKNRSDLFGDMLLSFLSTDEKQIKEKLSYYFSVESKIKAMTAREEVNRKGYDEKKGAERVKKLREKDRDILFLSKIISMELSEEEQHDAQVLNDFVEEENEKGYQLEEVDEDDELKIALGKL